MDGRLANIVGALLVSGIVVAIAALLSLLVRLIFKRRIGTSNYYIGALVIGGALYGGLLAVLTHDTTTARAQTATESRDTPTAFGLDSPFIAPPESQLETFPAQLDAAFQRLGSNDRAELSGAMEFIVFASSSQMAKIKPAEFEQMSERDLAAKQFLGLYYFAKSRGSSMTLRQYIEMADVFKKEKPQFWEDYKAAKAAAK